MISVVICTRDRPDHIGRAVRSVLSGTHTDMECLVVDQSRDDRTRRAVHQAAAGDPRVRYAHREQTGKSKALNFGIRRTAGDIIALTDDDCEAHPDWLAAIARLMQSTQADILCGRVATVPHDPSCSYTCGFEPGPSRILTGRGHRVRTLGIGANMAIRRSLFARVGYFDEVLGPGEVIPSGEDRDLIYRALRRRCRILMAPEAVVVHHGTRFFGKDSRDDSRHESAGLAVPYAKFMRRGDPTALYHCLADILGDACSAAGRALLWRRPLGINRIRFLMAGLASSMTHPLDPESMVFRTRPQGGGPHP